MKTYKVEIPEDQIDFMLSLFKQLKFVSYQEAIQEKRDYVAKDYMKEKGLIPKTSSTSSEEERLKKMEGLSSLRDTINRLQKNRLSSTPGTEFLFRLPTSGLKDKPVGFSNYKDLKNYLEKYFRIGIDKIEFTPNKETKQNEIDDYIVQAFVKDANSKITIISAGYCNQIIN